MAIKKDKIRASAQKFLQKGQIDKAIEEVEKSMGAKFGDPKNPLLLSVRSGARASLPLTMADRTVVEYEPEMPPAFLFNTLFPPLLRRHLRRAAGVVASGCARRALARALRRRARVGPGAPRRPWLW